MDKYYRNVPPEMLEQFMQFRRQHPLKTCVIKGVRWEYLTAGSSSGKPLLLLPGGLSIAESTWRMITSLDQSKYHLLCPSYPPELGTMTELADGIAQLLAREGIQDAFVVGRAYSSMLAQVFVHLYPSRVTKLALADAYPPVLSRVFGAESNLRMATSAPMFIVRNMVRGQITGSISSKASPELLVVKAQVREAVDTRMSRKAAQSIFTRMIEFDQMIFKPANLARWHGKILLIFTEGDPSTPEELRTELLALYPGARLQLFKAGSHATPLLVPEEYIQVMQDFFGE